jgi:hypothetical protein
MTRYFGVKCGTCEEPISLATDSIDESRKRSFCFVPVVPVPCPYCGTSHLYALPDAIYFDGPDNLLSQRVGTQLADLWPLLEKPFPLGVGRALPLAKPRPRSPAGPTMKAVFTTRRELFKKRR